MSGTLVDLRTDFVSRPTPDMIEAMTDAAAQPPGFGLRDDPIVAKLESKAAATLGKADALFCPTCAMANQIAIHLHCRPGELFIAEAASHVILSEGGAPAALTGVGAKPVPGTNGVPDAGDIASAVHVGAPGRSRTSLVVLENTHVHSGGRVMDLASMRAISEIAKRAAIPIHLDGSRLFNAATALGTRVDLLAAPAASVSVSMNKALGAPLGAILAGDKGFIEEAVRVRQMFGGGWRPAGIPAAAALIALETMTERLAQDHARAQRLAEGLAGHTLVTIDLDQVQTNIVFARSHGPLAPLVEQLRSRGILVHPISQQAFRMVTYHNIGDDEIERTLTAFRDLANEWRPS